MRSIALIVVLAVQPAGAALTTDAEREQAAERLSARALDTIEGILGPGHAKVHIEVQGERAEISSETEILSPIEKASSAGQAATRLLDLPGYFKDRAAEEAAKPKPETPAPQQFYQKDNERSRHDAGFQIKSIQATVVLDSALDAAVVRDVSQLLPQVLKIDTTRGDTITILRATMRPAWKSAFATPSDWRSASYAIGAGVTILIAALIAGLGLILAGRSLGRELGSRIRPEPTPLPAGNIEAIPELTPGVPPGILDAGTPGTAGGAPLLGRRFDFLTGKDPELLARALSTEKAEDLSLFFGHLAESIPDLASRLFAHMPGDVQAEVSQSLVRLSVADPDRLSAIEDRLRQAVENGVIGPQSLGRILSRVPGDARADLLGRLAARDAHAVEEVERHVFAFENLGNLNAAALRRLLGAVAYEVWGPALRGAPAELIDRVLADLPEGPRQMVRDLAATPQPREKINEARSKILDALSAFAAKGEVDLGRPEEGSEMV
jgi:hypothetical protein